MDEFFENLELLVWEFRDKNGIRNEEDFSDQEEDEQIEEDGVEAEEKRDVVG